MTHFSPTPPPLPPRTAAASGGTLTRVRWDHIAMAGAGIAVVLGVVSTLMSWSSPDADTRSNARPPAATAAAADPATAADAAAPAGTDVDGTGSVTDPLEVDALVVEARDFMAQGRWDEAIDRLDTIAPELRASSGADEVRSELTAARTKWTSLDQSLRSHVASLDWGAAKTDLAELVLIAPLNDEQMALRDQVQAALAPRTAEAEVAKAVTAAEPIATKAKSIAKANAATNAAVLNGLLGAGGSNGGAATDKISKGDAATIKQLTETLKDVSAMATEG